MKNHKHFDDLLLQYYYDDGTNAERQLFEDHLRGCVQCREQLDQLRAMSTILSQEPAPKPSAALLERANRRVMHTILAGKKRPVFTKIKEFWEDLTESLEMALARPRYQLIAAGTIFAVGMLVGKIWLSSGLLHDPQMLANFVNRGALLTSQEKDDFQKAFANYMLGAGGAEVSDLVQKDGDGDNNGIVEVNVKIQKDFALSGGLDDPTIQNMLRYSALRETDPEKRLGAVKLLSKVKANPGTEETMIAVLLRDSVESIRHKSMESLESYALSEQIIEAYKSVALNDTSSELKTMALDRLAILETADIIPIFALVASQEKDEQVKRQAERYLEQIRQK